MGLSYFDPVKREIALSAALPRGDGWLTTASPATRPDRTPLREFRAESNSCATLLALGLDTSGYSLDSIKWWTREPGMVKTAMPEIVAATKRLIAIMEGERPEALRDWL